MARIQRRPRCDRPPAGWLCSRGLDHRGPCAARAAWWKRAELWVRGTPI